MNKWPDHRLNTSLKAGEWLPMAGEADKFWSEYLYFLTFASEKEK